MQALSNTNQHYLGRGALPPPEHWTQLSESPTTPEAQRALLRRLAVIRAERDEVLVLAADLNDGEQVTQAIDAAVARFGAVDLVVHGAANVSPRPSGRRRTPGPRWWRPRCRPRSVACST